jgi:hypothetical protein
MTTRQKTKAAGAGPTARAFGIPGMVQSAWAISNNPALSCVVISAAHLNYIRTKTWP